MSKRRKKEEVYIPAMHLHEPINLVELGREWEPLDENARIQSLRQLVKDSETITDEAMRAAVKNLWNSSARKLDGEEYYLHHILEKGSLFMSVSQDITEKKRQINREMAEEFFNTAPKRLQNIAIIAEERGRRDIVNEILIGYILGYSDKTKAKLQQFIDEL